MLSVMRRELSAFFHSYRGYAFIGIFAIVFCSFQLVYHAYDLGEVVLVLESASYGFYVLEHWLEFLPIAFTAAIPMLTCGMFTREQQDGTGSFVRSLPITAKDILFGKYLAALFLFIVSYICFILIAAFTGLYSGIGGMRILISFIFYILVCNAVLAIQLFVAAVCKNKYMSFALGIGVSALLIVLTCIRNIGSGVLKSIITSLSVIGTYASSVYGIFDITALVLCVTVFLLFIYLAYTFVKKRIKI